MLNQAPPNRPTLPQYGVTGDRFRSPFTMSEEAVAVGWRNLQTPASIIDRSAGLSRQSKVAS